MKHTAQRLLALVLTLMMVLSVTTAFASGKTVAINKKNFPDKAFRKYISKEFDKNGDGKLSSKEISKARSIGLFGDNGIRSLEGIQYFTALGSLTVYEPVTSLDLRKNTALADLDVVGAPLKTLKITGLKKLCRIQIDGTKLKSVDIAGCIKLLSIIKKHCTIRGGCIEYVPTEKGDDYYCFSFSKTTKIMKGSKLLRKYAKPKSIQFSKSSITVKKGEGFYLTNLLKMTPSTCIYPVKLSTSNIDVVDVDDDWCVAFEAGTATITAKCAGKTAKIKITVVE